MRQQAEGADGTAADEAGGGPAGTAGARQAVLVLHGGQDDSRRAARPWQLAALRMRPFARALTRALPESAVLVDAVRYRYRGWNGASADPAHDTERALDALAERYGDGLSVVLVGHSMGGRAALRAAGHPLVSAVVGLAPWCLPADPVAQLRGRTVVVLHGDHDRVTSAPESLAMAGRARAEGARVGALIVSKGEHALLRRAGLWKRMTTDTVAALLGRGPLPEPVRSALDSPEPVRL